MRTLREAKEARGGHCFTCGKDIMGEEETDHTFCNECWDANLAHPFNTEFGNYCINCDQPEEARIHDLTWANERFKSLGLEE